MDAKIAEFTQQLRNRGLTVSTAELMDALRAVQNLGLADARLVRETLRCTLVKRQRDIEVFEELFERFFFGERTLLDQSEKRFQGQLRLSESALAELLQRIDALQREAGVELSALTLSLLRGDLRSLWRELHKALTQAMRADNGEASSIPAESMRDTLDWGRIERELDALKGTAEASSWEEGARRDLERYLQYRLDQLSQLVRRLVERPSESAGTRRALPGQLLDKSFAHYSEDDVRRMHEVIRRLAQHFKNLLAIRRKRAARGRLDLKRTLRENLQYGGLPVRIQWDRKRRIKPQVVVLCDISDSVLNASRFMMQFVYSMQELYTKVRSFVFVSDIAEVTHLFRDAPIQEAVEAALKGDVINVFEHSNFGHAFRLFQASHLDAVNRQTTVIIMGDGRNNYYPANEWALREIGQRAKHVFWLNPENESTWGIGDSEMPRYMEYCSRVEECRNIQQLFNFIERIAR